MKVKLALLSLALIGSPAFAQEIQLIKLPEGFQKGDFYVESLEKVDMETQEMYILKGDKVKLIKFKVPINRYKVSDSDVLLPEVGYKLPGVKDTRPFKEQHPRLSKLFKIGSFVLSPLSYVLSLAD